MLFPTHLVVGYLCALRWDLAPSVVVVGAALPDVIDKSVAMVGLYDLYHSAGHSAFAVLLLTPAALALGRRAAALWMGWTAHLPLDALNMVLNGRPDDVWFLAWPLIEHTPSVSLPPVEFALSYLGTPSFYTEVLVWGALSAVIVERVRSRRAASAE
jgi:hypothetical protein